MQSKVIKCSHDRSMLATHGEFALPSVPDFRPIVGLIHPRLTTPVGFKLPLVRISRFQGFTLIELMIALLVLSILASVAIPSIQPVIRKNRLTTETNRILSDLAYARAEAIMRSGNVTLCSSSDGATCVAEDWASGRLIYADLNGDGAPTAAGGEVLRYSGAPNSEATIVASGIVYPLVYQARGIPNGAGAGTGLLITVNGLPSTEFRDVCINATGQTRVRRVSTDTAC